mgnify:CR=1 FL=1|jgi:hypothetical protein
MYQLNGKTLLEGEAFTTEDGQQYPANWLQLTSLEEKQAIGIAVVDDPVAPATWDERFYWNLENPKDLAELKADWISRTKESASSMLSQTDWYVVRQAENSAAVPADVLSRRAEIRTMSGDKETAIAACADVAALAEYVTGSAFNSWEPTPTPSPTPSEE